MIKSVALLLAASTLLLAGCSKSSPARRAGDPSNLVDWGVVELSANVPKHLSLGAGKDCTLTAASLPSGDLQIKIETKEKLSGAGLPPGIPVGSRVESTTTHTTTVPAGVEIVISVGHTPVRLKAKLKA